MPIAAVIKSRRLISNSPWSFFVGQSHNTPHRLVEPRPFVAGGIVAVEMDE
jgi:hypothetical protein